MSVQFTSVQLLRSVRGITFARKDTSHIVISKVLLRSEDVFYASQISLWRKRLFLYTVATNFSVL